MREATWKFVAMANDVQNLKRLSAQWNVEHVQGNDAVKLVSAWECGLSRRLWFRGARPSLHNDIHDEHIRALQVSRIVVVQFQLVVRVARSANSDFCAFQRVHSSA